MYRLIVILLAALVACGCYMPMPGKWVSIESRVPGKNPGARFAMDADVVDEPPYRLGIKDRIIVDVKRHPEFSIEAEINKDGNIRIPVADKIVKVAGLTKREAEYRIAGLVSPYTVAPPEVDIRIKSTLSQSYSVLGAVRGPGLYELDMEDVTIREALFRAGLNSKEADMNNVYVIEPDVDEPRYVVVNLEEIMLGRTRYNFKLKNNDIIYVPKNSVARFDDVIDEILRRGGKAQTLDSFIRSSKDRLREDD